MRIARLAGMDIGEFRRDGLAERDALLAAGKTGDSRFELAREFAAADKIIISAPFWDLSFPAALKIYFENVSVCGITFGFNGNRMFGCCRCRRLAYITTRGGDFSGGDSDMEMAVPQLKAFSKMFGLGDIVVIAAEGIDIAGADSAGILAAAAERARSEAVKF